MFLHTSCNISNISTCLQNPKMQNKWNNSKVKPISEVKSEKSQILAQRWQIYSVTSLCFVFSATAAALPVPWDHLHPAGLSSPMQQWGRPSENSCHSKPREMRLWGKHLGDLQTEGTLTHMIHGSQLVTKTINMLNVGVGGWFHFNCPRLILYIDMSLSV